MALPVFKGRIGTASLQRLAVPPKAAASIYHSKEFKDWREIVIDRAGGRCQQVVAGVRCDKARPLHRMFADHIVELKDGGAAFDPANGQCLCGAHHSAKTAQARSHRRFG